MFRTALSFGRPLTCRRRSPTLMPAFSPGPFGVRALANKPWESSFHHTPSKGVEYRLSFCQLKKAKTIRAAVASASATAENRVRESLRILGLLKLAVLRLCL